LRESLWNPVGVAMILPGIVPKLRQAQTYLATIGPHPGGMQFLAMISVLALLTMSGAAVSDRFLTADQHVAQGVE
jgi:hypothetical protein